MPRGESSTATPPPSAGAASAVYVYGVVAGPAPAIGDPGVGSGRVRAIEEGGLAALVSDVSAEWRAAGRADVEAHDRVVGGLVGRGTVIPMRFGIVMASDEEVRERLLGLHAGELTSLLERLDGRVQMSLKAFYVEEALLRKVLERHPELKRRSMALEAVPPAASHDQRIALGRDVAAAVEEQRGLDEQALVAPLAEVAEEILVDAPASDRQAAAFQLLVHRDKRERLDAAVQRLAQQHGDRFALRYVGPVPPYSFADLSLDAGR
jgi:Gas vesicle synthesis protein GvpL/GvpF